VQTHVNIAEVKGESSLEAINIAHADTGNVQTVPATALFIFIGAMPRTEWVAGVVERDSQGFILSGPPLLRNGCRPQGWTLARDPFLLETSVPGVFVAGDVRYGSVKRVASGVGEGSIAVQFVHQYLSGVK
jgi:thioredoxin reductase (NADPH)